MAVDLAEGEVVEPARRRRRFMFATLVAAGALVVAGGIVAWSVTVRYAHARPLRCGCAIGWDAQDASAQVLS